MNCLRKSAKVSKIIIFVLFLQIVSAAAVHIGIVKRAFERVSEWCTPRGDDPQQREVSIFWRPGVCLLLLKKKNSQLRRECQCVSKCRPVLSNPSTANCESCRTDCSRIMQLNVDSKTNALKCNCVAGSDVVADFNMTTTTTSPAPPTNSSPTSTASHSPTRLTKMMTSTTTEPPEVTMAKECECTLYCLPRTRQMSVSPCVFTLAISKKLKSPNNEIDCECGIDKGEKEDQETNNPIFKCICSKNSPKNEHPNEIDFGRTELDWF